MKLINLCVFENIENKLPIYSVEKQFIIFFQLNICLNWWNMSRKICKKVFWLNVFWSLLFQWMCNVYGCISKSNLRKISYPISDWIE